jgi:predicted nucleic acid-binding protein
MRHGAGDEWRGDWPDDLRTWPGERYGQRALLDRVWDLRGNVRGWDAFYVALAEALDATLLTLDHRLGRAAGLRCAIEVLDSGR